MNTNLMKTTSRVIGVAVSVVFGSCTMLAMPMARADTTAPMPIAPAVATVCEPGTINYSTSGVTKTQTIVAASVITNGNDSAITSTYTAGVQTTLTSSVSATVSGSYTASAVLGQLQVSAGITLAQSGSSTSSWSTSTQVTIQPKQTVVLAAGTTSVKGSWSSTYCNTNGTSFVSGASGTVGSFGPETLVVVACNVTQSAGSIAALAKTRFC